MGSSRNSGPSLGPQYSTAPLSKDLKRVPSLDNYPYIYIYIYIYIYPSHVIVGLPLLGWWFPSILCSRRAQSYQDIFSEMCSRDFSVGCYTHRPLSSSFWGLLYRILNISHKKELLRGLWVASTSIQKNPCDPIGSAWNHGTSFGRNGPNPTKLKVASGSGFRV